LLPVVRDTKSGTMKNTLLFLLLTALVLSCTKKSSGDGIICTQEFRMITLHVRTASNQQATLDSAYTLRISTGEKFYPEQSLSGMGVVVLDDRYQPRLQHTQDNFRFVGWKGGQVVVDQPYRIGADACHIYKVSGVDSVLVP